MKKLISLLLTVMMLSSLFSVCVSAEVLTEQDFHLKTEEDDEYYDPLAGWTLTQNGNNKIEVTEDGAMKMTHDYTQTSGGGAVAQYSISLPTQMQDIVWTFDIMYHHTHGTFYSQLGAYSERASISEHGSAFGEANVWYEVLMHVKYTDEPFVDSSGTHYYYDVYKRVKGSGEPYTPLKINSTTGDYAQTCIRHYTTKGNQGTESDPDYVVVDNHKLFCGIFTEDFKFLIDGGEITSTEDIAAAGTVTAEFNLVNTDIADAVTDTPITAERSTVLPVMVAFDKDGMMLDCKAETLEVDVLDNDVSVDFDISSIYDKLGGGTIRFYIWDSIESQEALIDEIVLPAE